MAQGIARVSTMGRIQEPIVAANSEVFADASPVSINSSGFLAVSTSAGEKIWGYCLRPFTAISTNQTGTAGTYQLYDAAAARFAPPILAPEGVVFWADSDLALTDTDLDVYCDIASVSSGVVTLNLAGGSTGQFKVMNLASNSDPSAEGDTDRIYVMVAEPQGLAFAQS